MKTASETRLHMIKLILVSYVRNVPFEDGVVSLYFTPVMVARSSIIMQCHHSICHFPYFILYLLFRITLEHTFSFLGKLVMCKTTVGPIFCQFQPPKTKVNVYPSLGLVPFN